MCARDILVPLMFMVATLSGCAQVIHVPGNDQIHNGMATAEIVATEPNFDDINSYLKRPTETRCEIGTWLPDGGATLLVTLDIMETSHAEGLVHHLIAVFDPVSHRRLTPVFHYIADHAERQILTGRNGQQCLLYVGRIEGNMDYRRDSSFLVTFAPGEIRAERLIGRRNPEEYCISWRCKFPDVALNLQRIVGPGRLVETVEQLEWEANPGRFMSRPAETKSTGGQAGNRAYNVLPPTAK